ncbi:Protein pad-1 [Caenorhabditis elegans]|uniref:Protein pad-1 n=1 Tax=Caenorhabditis elegans TaxID=6239 RepID=PAD1_CAEEL|nr:Protein pad-1 [Caenorhabditis elegans]Q9XW10.2 RecName: Full=Protein pad-1; AltName: Full=Patterning defective protein 1 [Caenorhabditis elegans]CAA22324.2 Protein pad-1 [Caenorhabditis elegans]|eukprot:NP_493252.3 Protein pad-1 [Caenorhabditis elegans]
MASASGGDVPAGREKDSKYRAYAKAIDQALKTFETPNEWADLISALGKLAKVFQSNAKFCAIPNRVTVAKRLSQCLHPALPMGVHLKALETYRQIFEILGPNKLPECLYLFAVGLFPLMDHCGIKVKSELFTIFENYLVPLGANLRPALPGFLGGVLLALEEGTEFYERSFILLDRVCEKVGPRAFYACLWQAILGSPPVRLPAMIYVNAKFDKLKSLDDQIHLVGDHVNHMVAALCAVADDTGSPLVQRYLLDFLVAAFPLDSTNLTNEDFVQLLRRCLFVVLRRDMSLNRRLYTWLINRSGETKGVSGLSLGGPDDGIELTFFKERVLGLVHGALGEYLALDTIETPFANHQNSMWGDRKEAEQVQFAEVRVCRLLLYLQDRADIGRTILETVFADFLKKSAEFHSSSNSSSLKKSPRKIQQSLKNPRKPGDREGLYLDLNSVCSTSNKDDDVTSVTSSAAANASSAPPPDEEDLVQARRIDELSKTFNMLLNSLEPGFLWTFLGDWYRRIVENNEFERQIHDFSQVVSVCLEMCNVESDPTIRTQHLPRLLETVLEGVSNKNLLSSCDQSDLLQLYTVCQKLLEISTAHPPSPIEVDEIAEDSLSMSQEVTAIEHERSQTDACLSQCLSALSAIFEIYTTRREASLIPLIDASTTLLNAFLEVPIYYLGFGIVDNPGDYCRESSEEVQPWLKNMLKVIDGPGWLREMRAGLCADVSARASLLELLCKIYVKSVQVLEQHEEAAHRPHDDFYDEMTHVLLKPLLAKRDCQFIEQGKVFGTCGEAVWLGIGSRKFCTEQQRLARLLVELHSRRPLEASSDVESIVVQSLTSTDDLVCSEAARTFHRIWVLARNLEDREQQGIPYQKPFNRAVMILLGVLADESVAKTRTELKAAAAEWFHDCSKHQDLPRIVQMLSTMLMNPVTARISIQYIRQETKMTTDTCPVIPADISAVTLVTIDGKQRLYHVTGQPAIDSSSTESTWITEVRNRLLRTSTGEDSGDPSAAGAAGILRSSSPDPDVVPAFDDDTDSLDTLSMSDSIDETVIHVLREIVDQVCEEFNEEDLERERIMTMFAMDNVEPTGASFNLPHDSEADDEVAERPAPICPDSLVQRVKKGHRRQDSLQESIFNMTDKDLSAFDTSEIFRPSTESVSRGTGAGAAAAAAAAGASSKDTILPGTVSSASSTSSAAGGTSSLFEEMHTHMLLYGESGKVVDLARAETAFRILTALLAPRGATGNRMLLNCLVSSGTTTTSDSSAEHSLVELMNRHVRAILGQHFWSAPASDEEKHKHITLLELLITISLHFLRSYFLNSPISPVTEADLTSLWKCKISALEFLCELFRELSAMLNEHESKQFVQFVQTILNRSKLQKCILHLLLTAVDHNPMESSSSKKTGGGGGPLSVSISKFNEGLLGESRRLSPLLAAYHRSLLTFTSHAIRLECDIKRGFATFSDANSSHRFSIIQSVMNQSFNNRTSRVDNHASTVELRAFLLILLNALKKQPHRHEMWLQFVVQILPWVERSLATIVCRVVEQLCKNMENAMSVAYENPPTSDVVVDSPGDVRDEPDCYPANYLAMTMELLTTLVHFCVIDSVPTSAVAGGAPGVGGAGGVTSSSGGVQQVIHENATPTPSSTSMVGHAMSVIPGSKVATELFSQLGKVFSMSGDSGGVISKLDSSRQHGNGWRQAQSDMLSSLPHSLATICNVWTVVRRAQPPIVPIGTNSQLRRLVLHLLSPIAQYHKHAFLTSLALVWLTRSTAKPTVTLRKQDPDRATFEYSSAQLDITNLLLSLQVIPFEDLISSVNSTLREASFKANKVGITTIDKANFPTEEPLLELVHSCVSAVLQTQLRLCWSSLLSLFSEAPLSALSARAVFLLFVILSDFVKCVGGAYIVEDKAMYRNVQEVCSRLAEAVNAIVGWQLETTTWLKRTLVVKQDHGSSISSSIRSVDQSPIIEIQSSMSNVSGGGGSLDNPSGSTRNSTLSLINKPGGSIGTGSSVTSTLVDSKSENMKIEKKSSSNLRASIKDTNNNRRDPAHSTQALFLLAERLTDLLDSVSKSDEKDKVLPTLQAVWANVVPYLKAKNARNARFFLASSQLLASMSSYSYMRPVWKKTTLDLLLDSGFFKMDHSALKQWLVVTDHLMTHDRTSFKDLLKSISYSPNTSFSIMTSKEQEYEARAQALKRLTFVVFGSQLDQYHGQMNDIQERLSDNLRVSQSPVIRSAVFLCIRVLLLRLRPHSLIGVWPIMVTELVHALSQLEQQLQSGEQDSGATAASSDQWMQLYVAACKLLETLCTLPAGYLSHFQMFHWAFVSSVSADKTEIFKPFAERINDLLAKKYGELLTPETMSNHTASLGAVKILTSFEELRPFFYTLANLNKSVPESNNTLRDAHALSGSLTYKNAVARLESALYVDFSEHLQF